MKKGLSYLAVGVAAGVAAGRRRRTTRCEPPAPSANDELALFAEVFNKVRDNYAEKPDDDKMIKSAIDGMLASLDPHSTYFDPKALQDFQTSMKGEEFGGLGLEVMMEDGLVKVVSPIDDTPAARAGLMSGDLVTRIDDTPVKGLTLKEAVDKMRGPAKSSVRLTVERGSNKDLKEYTIVREIIHVQSVRSHVEGGDIGYIRITQFNQEAYDGVRKAFDHFRADPGSGEAEGLHPRPAQQSWRAAQPGGRDHQRVRRQRRRSSRRAAEMPIRSSVTPRGPASICRSGKPVVVLINGGSASASEIVSGALAGSQARDTDRHALIRQGVGADHPAARRERRPQADDRALLHAVRPLDPGQGHRAQTSGCSRTFPTTSRAKSPASERPRCSAISRTDGEEEKGSDAYVPPDQDKDTQLQAAVELLHGAKAETLRSSRRARDRDLAMTLARWLVAVALARARLAWLRRRRVRAAAAFKWPLDRERAALVRLGQGCAPQRRRALPTTPR